jgi:phosphoadenylyl-sulfate reductase (thioredoxin)
MSVDAVRLSDAELDAAAARLEDASPEAIVRWAADTFAPRLGFATGFGVEGCVIVDLVATLALPVDIFTLDTGLLFPETYALWQRLEARYGVTIRGVRPAQTVEQQAATHGDALWRRDPDACCALRKVAPLAAEAAKLDAWITAIRRDQTPERATARVVERDARHGIVKVNPLVRWTTADVWRHVLARDIPYNPLHDQGYPSIGCAPCTGPVAEGEDPRAGRWRGQAKTECGLHAPTSAAPISIRPHAPSSAGDPS